MAHFNFSRYSETVAGVAPISNGPTGCCSHSPEKNGCYPFLELNS